MATGTLVRLECAKLRLAEDDLYCSSWWPSGPVFLIHPAFLIVADKTNITCTKVDVNHSYQISLIQIMISTNLDPLVLH
jgi:hypothetical protein